MKLGLIGWPLGYSLSPEIHGHWMDENNIEGTYDLWPTNPKNVPRFLDTIQERGVKGCNVTIPHKRAVMELMDECSDEAQSINAVNTICFETDGKKIGHNTDIIGFQNDLKTQMGNESSPRKALLLGAGGAASAVIYALKKMYPLLYLYVSSRKEPSESSFHYVPWEEHNSLPDDIDLVINATPLGKTDEAELGLKWDMLKEGTFLYDLNYHADETALVHAARINGMSACDGLGMLIRQAQEAFRIWVDVLPVIDDDFLSFIRDKTKN